MLEIVEPVWSTETVASRVRAPDANWQKSKTRENPRNGKSRRKFVANIKFGRVACFMAEKAWGRQVAYFLTVLSADLRKALEAKALRC